VPSRSALVHWAQKIKSGPKLARCDGRWKFSKKKVGGKEEGRSRCHNSSKRDVEYRTVPGRERKRGASPKNSSVLIFTQMSRDRGSDPERNAGTSQKRMKKHALKFVKRGGEDNHAPDLTRRSPHSEEAFERNP